MPRTRTLVAAMAAALCALLLLQPGNPIDEAEHLHVAWLMTRGLRPIHDFFEHHAPLLWWVLEPIVRMVPGPQSLHVARLLVVACVLGWIFSLATVSRRLANHAALDFAAPMALVAFVAVFSDALFVVRPETLSFALLGIALVAWTAPGRSVLHAVFAGAALALCAFASPRFVLVAPVFALVDPDPPGLRQLRHAAVAAASGVAVVAGLLGAVYPLRDFVFAARFSSVLQNVGPPPAWLDHWYLAADGAVAAIAGIVFARMAPRSARLAAWLGAGAAIWAICFAVAGRYWYAQAFAPGLAWLLLFLSTLDAKARAHPLHGHVRHALAGAALLTLACGLVAGPLLSPYTPANLTRVRKTILGKLGAHETVLLYPVVHPITAMDASYWGPLLLNPSGGKICLAADEYARRHPDASPALPKCGILEDLAKHPPAVASRRLDASAATPAGEESGIRAVLERDYAPATEPAADPRLWSEVLFRCAARPCAAAAHE